jgi:hypothetical protein
MWICFDHQVIRYWFDASVDARFKGVTHMRFGLILTSLSVTMLATVTVLADPAAPAPAAAAPAAPPAGEAPPPPGYPPPGYAAPSGERTANNSLYIEGLGPGIFYSMNYDRTFGDFAGRVGFSYISVSASSGTANAHASFMTIPLTLSYLGIGSKKHIFEIGAGATIVHVGAGGSAFAVDEKNGSASATAVLGDLIFGYRMQPPDGGFLLRAGISPIFGGGSFIPLPYIALGGTF